jgi:hypothetical protein
MPPHPITLSAMAMKVSARCDLMGSLWAIPLCRNENESKSENTSTSPPDAEISRSEMQSFMASRFVPLESR